MHNGSTAIPLKYEVYFGTNIINDAAFGNFISNNKGILVIFVSLKYRVITEDISRPTARLSSTPLSLATSCASVSNLPWEIGGQFTDSAVTTGWEFQVSSVV